MITAGPTLSGEWGLTVTRVRTRQERERMTRDNDLPPGGQAPAAWARPTRSKAERRAHVLRRLESEDKLWIATAATDGSAHLVRYVQDIVANL